MSYPEEQYAKRAAMEQAYDPMRPGHGSLSGARIDARQSSGFMNDIHERLVALVGAYGETGLALEMIADRIFGAQPKEASGADKVREPYSETEKLGLALDMLTMQLRRIQNETGRLNAL
jgi:hypothetical protein